MNSLNASNGGSRQKWRNDFGFKNLSSQEVLKDPTNLCFRNQVLASTICCSRSDCDKVKVEHVQERLFRREPGNTVVPLLSTTTYPAGRNPSATAGKKETAVIPDYAAFCPCLLGTGHLITYCCVRRDCDDASKIGGTRERPSAFSLFKY